jgi:hypothetical protein
MPQHPDPVAARIIPIEVNYVSTVYVTAEEKERLERSYLWAQIGGFVLLAGVTADTMLRQSVRCGG